MPTLTILYTGTTDLIITGTDGTQVTIPGAPGSDNPTEITLAQTYLISVSFREAFKKGKITFKANPNASIDEQNLGIQVIGLLYDKLGGEMTATSEDITTNVGVLASLRDTYKSTYNDTNKSLSAGTAIGPATANLIQGANELIKAHAEDAAVTAATTALTNYDNAFVNKVNSASSVTIDELNTYQLDREPLVKALQAAEKARDAANSELQKTRDAITKPLALPSKIMNDPTPNKIGSNLTWSWKPPTRP